MPSAPTTETIDRALRHAIACHGQQQLGEADQLYRAILELQPDHPDANHNLGILILQSGNPQGALAYLLRALEAKPDAGRYWLSYAEGLLAAGQAQEALVVLDTARQHGLEDPAEDSLRARIQAALSPPSQSAAPAGRKKKAPALPQAKLEKVLALFNKGDYAAMEAAARQVTENHPDSGKGWQLLGLSYLARNLNDQALAPLERARELSPDDAEVWDLLGAALTMLGRLDEAAACFSRSLELAPNRPETWNNAAKNAIERGHLEDAITCYQRALELNPKMTQAIYGQGVAQYHLRQFDAAVASYRKALALEPNNAEIHCNLGVALEELNQLDAAYDSFQRALRLRPDYPDAYNNLGTTLQRLGQFDEAIASFRRALELKPDYAEAHMNRGNTLNQLGRLDQAAESTRRALELRPDYPEAHSNLGNTFRDSGQIDQAVQSCRAALEKNPAFIKAHNNLLFALNYHPDLPAEAIYEAYREYDQRFGLPLRSTWQPHANSPDPDRRLRVGYVSPDFRNHSAANFLAPLLAHHDKSVVEVFAYAELPREDQFSERFKATVDHWVPTFGLSDQALADRIRADGIDILVDLAGHTAGNRLQVFARKPAPVSISWMGYGYTTGLSAIDWFLTDEIIVPAGFEHLFAEKPWRLASPSYAYRPADAMGDVSPLPALANGYVTFGTLSRSVRINAHTVRVWAQILRDVPGAKLAIDSGNFRDSGLQQRMAAQFAAHGIAADRLLMGCHSPPWDFLRQQIDIGLDCFPHNSGTTLFEMLHMGVPIVTLAARPSVGRLGASLLTALGKPEWIAADEEAYRRIAVALASDLPTLARTRATLRPALARSPVMDEPGFVRRVEAAYRSMWQIWCKDRRPKS